MVSMFCGIDMIYSGVILLLLQKELGKLAGVKLT